METVQSLAYASGWYLMMPASDIQAVLAYYALNPAAVQRIEPLANAGGWSGSRLWRIDVCGADIPVCPNLWQARMPAPPGGGPRTATAELCLRRWPQEHPTSERLRLIHDVLVIVSSGLPIVACPLPTKHGQTFVEHGEHLWELTHWLRGVADYHARPGRARLRAAMVALARFHELAARYTTSRGAAPAVFDRQRQWTAMRDKGLALIEQSLATPLDNAIDDRAAGLLAAAGEALQKQSLFQSLAAVPPLLLQPAIRDIHHDHVLFTGDEVTGLIDFGAMRIDTPLADVARLVGSLARDDADERQFALDAYSELRPLTAKDRSLIDLLDATGLILGALNWLMWLYVERRDMGPAEPILRRLDELLRRLELRNVP